MKRIFISAGHSKISPGYVNEGFREFDLNFEAVTIIKERLSIYKNLEVVSPPEDIYSQPYPQYLSQRIEFINTQHKDTPFDLVIDIHHNYADNPHVNGMWFIYGSEQGKNYADKLNSFLRKLEYRSRTVSMDELGRTLGFIKKTIPPAIIIECAFMSGNMDILLLQYARGVLYNTIADAIHSAVTMEE